MAVEFNILFYSSIAGLSTILGIILVILNEKLVLKYSHYVNSFAAGLILGVAFFHLFPESLELSDNALLFILIGFLVFYLLENVMVLHSGSEIHFKDKKGSRHTKGKVMFTSRSLNVLKDPCNSLIYNRKQAKAIDIICFWKSCLILHIKTTH